MPEKEIVMRALEDAREGKSPRTGRLHFSTLTRIGDYSLSPIVKIQSDD
jgi:hypothetical protein